MNTTIIYSIQLNEEEAIALNTLLGSMTDIEFEKAGIRGKDRDTMQDIYNTTPSKDE